MVRAVSRWALGNEHTFNETWTYVESVSDRDRNTTCSYLLWMTWRHQQQIIGEVRWGAREQRQCLVPDNVCQTVEVPKPSDDIHVDAMGTECEMECVKQPTSSDVRIYWPRSREQEDTRECRPAAKTQRALLLVKWTRNVQSIYEEKSLGEIDGNMSMLAEYWRQKHYASSASIQTVSVAHDVQGRDDNP